MNAATSREDSAGRNLGKVFSGPKTAGVRTSGNRPSGQSADRIGTESTAPELVTDSNLTSDEVWSSKL